MCKDCGNNCDYSDCYKWSCNRNKDILDKATKNAQKIVKESRKTVNTRAR